MGTQVRRQLPDIVQDLVDNPSQYGFYQAIRILEQAWSRHGSLGGELDRWVKLIPAPEISFPAADFRRCEYGEDFKITLECNFMGLYGVDAAVPHYLTEVTARDDEQSDIFRNFLDIFSHRFYSLFYQVWKKYNPALFLESDDTGYRNCLSAIAGRAAESTGGEELAYAGVLGGRNSNADGLKGIIREFLDTSKVGIEQFVSRWVQLDAIPALGTRQYGGLKLGDNTVIGARVLDKGGKIRLHIGPLSMSRVLNLLPQKKKGTELGELIKRYLSPSLTYDVVFLVIPDKSWRLQLGVTQANLGWTTLLGKFDGEHYTITIPGPLYSRRVVKADLQAQQQSPAQDSDYVKIETEVAVA
ncbi:Uncharacterized protein ImpH/VasB [hydrothermal vent metagenome]|uniref:Uncharacterized protein ImpH/VasB n=1 Tax=hydrothermal vent metagenome TaxID=652676 RepID=A0A3B0Y5V4_9ZZZZ